jgi:hypothetical protein
MARASMAMIGKQDRWQQDAFVAVPLSSLIPEDHSHEQDDTVLDLSGERRGRPSLNVAACQLSGWLSAMGPWWG